jgi:hypothetical protein
MGLELRNEALGEAFQNKPHALAGYRHRSRRLFRRGL